MPEPDGYVRRGGARRPRPDERKADPQDLGGVLDGLLAGSAWEAGLSLGELGRRWPSVVGERLAEEVRPAALRSGVLLVRASSQAWAAQVRFLARDVGRRANEVLGRPVVRDVRVVVGEDRRPRPG